jgi:hypothetical protein
VVEALEEKPEVLEELLIDWELFWQLSSRRSNGFNGPNPILISEIESIMRIYGIKEWRERMEFIQRINFMDNEYMKFCYPKKAK